MSSYDLDNWTCYLATYFYLFLSVAWKDHFHYIKNNLFLYNEDRSRAYRAINTLFFFETKIIEFKNSLEQIWCRVKPVGQRANRTKQKGTKYKKKIYSTSSFWDQVILDYSDFLQWKILCIRTFHEQVFYLAKQQKCYTDLTSH